MDPHTKLLSEVAKILLPLHPDLRPHFEAAFPDERRDDEAAPATELPERE